MNHKKIIPLMLVLSVFLSACSPGKSSKKNVQFSDDSQQAFPTLVDTSAKENIEVTKEFKFNQTANVVYKNDLGDNGIVEYKAKKLSEVAKAGELTAGENKKLILLEFSYKGSDKNKGQPSVINQIGSTPAPQFVLIDKKNNASIVESTQYSDAYAQSKKLFELYKLTLDNNKTVDTAMIFEIDKNLTPELAIRFTNANGKTEFYAVK